jgi:hypothetical protein
MNKKQKYVVLTAVFLITISLLWWVVQGTEFFTKTKVLVDNTSELDRLLGIENKQYEDMFILGMLPSGYPLTAEFLSVTTIASFVIVLSGFLLFVLRSRKETK